MTPSNFDGASMRCHDGEIWERLGFSDGLDIQQKLDILRIAQGRVTREKGQMKAAAEAVFFMPELESLAFIFAAHSKDFSPRRFLPSIIDLASS